MIAIYMIIFAADASFLVRFDLGDVEILKQYDFLEQEKNLINIQYFPPSGPDFNYNL